MRYLNDVSKTIGWADFSWNPITGCSNNCSYCYARKIALKYPKAFPDGFTPTFHSERLKVRFGNLYNYAKIFVADMGEFFDRKINEMHRIEIYRIIQKYPTIRFMILTKQPQNIMIAPTYMKLKNLWIGVTITQQADLLRIEKLNQKWNGAKFISFEPLLSPLGLYNSNIQGYKLFIIGTQTKPVISIRRDLVEHIIDIANGNNVEVYKKKNLVTYDPEGVDLQTEEIAEKNWTILEKKESNK